MEHFYEEMYNEEVFKSVQQIIRNSGFSANRTKDIVNISELLNDLTEFSDSIADCYKLSEVSFSKGDMVDLRDVRMKSYIYS